MGELPSELSIPQAPTEPANTNELLYPPSAEQLAAHFEEKFGRYIKGSMQRTEQDGTQVETRAYEFLLDPRDVYERQHYLVDFGVRAAQAGYKQALGPVVLPGVGVTAPERGSRPITGVIFFLEKPLRK